MLNLTYLQDKLREKRKIIIIALIVIAVLLLLVIGLWMQGDDGSREHAAKEQHQPPEQVRLTAGTGEQSAEGHENPKRKAAASYFLKPSADEVLAKIKELGEADLPAPNQKYAGLRVMWPVYFFQVLRLEGTRATVLLDVSENGFGATILTVIDTISFPEIGTTKRGAKIWVAGKIMGVDPSGTGTIRLLIEEVRFQESLEEAVRATGKVPEAEPAHVVPETSTKAGEGTH